MRNTRLAKYFRATCALLMVGTATISCKDKTAKTNDEVAPPAPIASARLSISINSKPLRIVDNAVLAKLTAIKPPPGASVAYRIADLLAAESIADYKHVSIILADGPPTNIGASLIDDPTMRPALAIYPDGKVTVFAKSGSMADSDGYLNDVTGLNIVSTSATVLRDGDGTINGNSAFEIVAADGSKQLLDNNQITALAKSSIPRKNKNVPAVPIEDLLATHKLSPGTSIEFVGKQKTISLPWPAKRTYLYASRQGALHLWRTAEEDDEAGMEGIRKGRVYELRNVQAIRVLQ